MPRELRVNVGPTLTRAAVLDDGQLQALFIERDDDSSSVGNIYRGQIVRVTEGLGGAFVDIGQARPALLSDAGTTNKAAMREGQKLWVQLSRDAQGNKGAQVTRSLSIAGHYLVFLPFARRRKVSRRIGSTARRKSVQSVLEEALSRVPLAPEHGLIARTVAQQADVDAIANELQFFNALWANVQQRAGELRKAGRVYETPPLIERLVRDYATYELSVQIDNADVADRVRHYCQQFFPQGTAEVSLYTEPQPLFDRDGVEQEITNALCRKVPLPGGGQLVFDHCEAMTVVDVNSHQYLQGQNPSATALDTNLDAVPVLVSQLRLRNVAGIIVVDFIDMNDVQDQRKLVARLREAMADDAAQHSVSEVGAAGLVTITRERRSASVEQLLCEPCPSCDGRGAIKSSATVCADIFRALDRLPARAGARITVVASAPVIERLQTGDKVHVAGFEAARGCQLDMRIDPECHREQFELAVV